ncbi:hypothetical protein [Ruicaihuangia caeni]|uniref:CBM2 domain-containing protein n=1 Tax=Ruicaihuangia caeni TaxID=3042517 RepID=A0AAW6T0T8_9MICO|nr:hypothetical protein [Klugiella sp. YN-L-19]MDI2097445.1 hypothetical protein [Klugiella sp. YN-L-19]
MTDDTSTDRSTGDPGKRHGADEAPPSIDESTIRAGLHDLASLADGSTLDSSDIARRARARRRPRLVAMTAVCSLALLGVGTVGVQALQQWNGSSTVTDSAAPLATDHGHGEAEMSNGATGAHPAPDDGSAEGASGDASVPAPLRCGDPAPAASATAPVTVAVEAPQAAPGANAVEADVTITNTSSSRITGWTAPLPTLVITDGARVLWHTHGAMIALAVEVDLAPGASHTFTGVFDAVSCTSDEALESGDTAPLSPGGYELMASVDLTLEDGGAIHAVSAPVSLTVG